MYLVLHVEVFRYFFCTFDADVLNMIIISGTADNLTEYFFILNHSICKNSDRNYLTLFCYCYYFVWVILWSTDSMRELSTKCRCFVPESGAAELEYLLLHWCHPQSTMKSLSCKLANAHTKHAQFQSAACTSWCTLSRGYKAYCGSLFLFCCNHVIWCINLPTEIYRLL